MKFIVYRSSVIVSTFLQVWAL